MNDTSLARLSQVHPKLSDLIQKLAIQMANEGIDLHVTQGLRSFDQQAILYAQGRTTPGPIVTNAPAGHSWHEYGLAVDVAPFDMQGKPDWDVNHPSWARIITVGESLGLYSGSHFGEHSLHPHPDDPHFQLTGNFSASPTDDVRALYKNSGLQAVWTAAFQITSEPDSEIAV